LDSGILANSLNRSALPIVISAQAVPNYGVAEHLSSTKAAKMVFPFTVVTLHNSEPPWRALAPGLLESPERLQTATNQQGGRISMINRKLKSTALAALLAAGLSAGAGGALASDAGIVYKQTASEDNSYCHIKYMAMTQVSRNSIRPISSTCTGLAISTRKALRRYVDKQRQ
jgi:hypothetical protein